MSRNQNSHFAVAPQVSIGRSRIPRNHSYKTSFNAGDLIPIYWSDILPGSTVSMDTAAVVRMQSLITPVMDNIYLDTYWFFVPNRLLWNHWQNLMGENTASAWIPAVTYQVPQVAAPSGGWNVGTIADYLGIPTGIDDFTVSALPFRAYALICQEWFRNQNVTDPLVIPVNDSQQTGSNGSTYTTDVVNGGAPFKAMKFHDYFTSCLPAPQKGSPVMIPLGDQAPVYGHRGSPLELVSAHQPAYTSGNANSYIFPVAAIQDPAITENPFYYRSVGWITNAQAASGAGGTYNPVNNKLDGDSKFIDKAASGYAWNLPDKDQVAGAYTTYPSSVYADLENATGISVNTLRTAFQVQKIFEKDARSGSRYTEILRGHFNVSSPDARLQRPEYLGGKRINVNINQVVQTSESGSTPQGNTAAYSLTTFRNSDFTKSFVEHGILMCVAVARYDHTYQQGLHKSWMRKDRFDFFWPALANVGEQPVLTGQLYLQGDSTKDNSVFGYQEAWADYRYFPNLVTSELRSSYATSLDSWHLADDYNSQPYLSDAWIREDKSNIDRCLAVQSSVSNQFFGDFYFKEADVLPMPLYSIPGLIDHH